MTSVRTSLHNAAALLRQADIPSAQLDAKLLLEYVLGTSREQLAARMEEALAAPQQDAYDVLLQRRLSREPVACITGTKGFWELEFRTTKDTLDPRPDTETLVEAVLTSPRLREEAGGGDPKEDAPSQPSPASGRGLDILDLGTGTGCILLTLLHLFPNARGVGVDASGAALEVARENAGRLGLGGRVEFRKGNWAEGLNGQFDIIVSNPPYIPTADIAALEPEVRDYDPLSALDGGVDGLQCYRELLVSVTSRSPHPNPPPRGGGKGGGVPLLKEGGILVLEIGQGQEVAVSALLEQYGFAVKELRKDLGGIIRCIVATAR